MSVSHSDLLPPTINERSITAGVSEVLCLCSKGASHVMVSDRRVDLIF